MDDEQQVKSYISISTRGIYDLAVIINAESGQSKNGRTLDLGNIYTSLELFFYITIRFVCSLEMSENDIFPLANNFGTDPKLEKRSCGIR